MTANTIGIARDRAHPETTHLGRIVAGAALMFVVLQGGLTVLVPRLDQTWSALIVTAAMFAILFTIEAVAFGRRPAQALAALGFGRPNPRALAVAGHHRGRDARVLPALLARHGNATCPAVRLALGPARRDRAERAGRGDAVPRLRLRPPAAGRPLVSVARASCRW